MCSFPKFLEGDGLREEKGMGKQKRDRGDGG